MSICVKKPRTMGQILRRATKTHPPVFQSIERLCQRYSAFGDRYAPISTNLRYIAQKHLGIDVQMPAIPVLARQVAALPYPQALEHVEETIENVAYELRQAFIDEGVGTLEASDTSDVWTFSFKDFERRRGILRDTLSHTPHHHTVAHARLRRIDDREVKLPAQGEALVADLLPCLRDELRVVTGTKVVEEVGPRHERRQWTALGKGLVGAGSAAVGLAPVLGAVALGGIGVLGAMAAAATVFAADPVLVLGDICLFGWDD